MNERTATSSRRSALFPIIRVIATLALLATAPIQETTIPTKPPVVIPGSPSPVTTASRSTNRDRT